MSRTEIEQAIARLSDEIRHYPTPIARCDLHLPALIEERSLLIDSLNGIETPEPSCSPEALWVNDGGFNAA